MYVLITFSVIPGQLDSFEKNFTTLIGSVNNQYQLLGVWRSEIGELNQAIHLWEYENNHKDLLNLYDDSKLTEVMVESHLRTITPAPFSKQLMHNKPLELSEIRIYNYQRKAIPEVIEKWSIKINSRLELSPMLMCGYTETEPECEWIHIWPYKNILERQEVRQIAIQNKIWPPGAFTGLISQKNLIVIPAKHLSGF